MLPSILSTTLMLRCIFCKTASSTIPKAPSNTLLARRLVWVQLRAIFHPPNPQCAKTRFVPSEGLLKLRARRAKSSRQWPPPPRSPSWQTEWLRLFDSAPGRCPLLSYPCRRLHHVGRPDRPGELLCPRSDRLCREARNLRRTRALYRRHLPLLAQMESIPLDG